MIRMSTPVVTIWSIAVPVPSRIACMCSKKACSVLSGRSLIVERPTWLVTPRGRIGSHSGCTVVLVDGTTMPIRLRYPNVSGTGSLRILHERNMTYCGRSQAGAFNSSWVRWNGPIIETVPDGPAIARTIAAHAAQLDQRNGRRPPPDAGGGTEARHMFQSAPERLYFDQLRAGSRDQRLEWDA